MKIRLLTTVILGILFICVTQTKAQWVQTNGISRENIDSFAISGTNLFAGTMGDGVFLSTNNGTSWTAVNTGLTDTLVTSLAVSGTNLFAGTDNYGGIFLSTNNGTSWTPENSGLKGYTVYSLAVNGTNLFAGTFGGGVFFSANNGTSWTPVNNGLTGYTVYSLAVNGTNLFAGTDGGVFLSNNNGTSWTAVNAGLTTYTAGGVAPVYSLAVNGTNLFAGTDGGVFLSTNNGTSWTAVNAGLTTTTSGGITSVNSLAVNGTNLFAGTKGYGVWMRPLSEMITGVKDKQNNLPTSFSLQQNYPNPFNPTTTIKYSIPQQSFVSILVYDLLGREVADLVNEEKSAGNYSVQFNSSSRFSSGVYFYRMQAGSFTETKKLIMMK